MYNLKDKELEKILNAEYDRQVNDIELIASENYVSQEVLKVMGSHLTNKYAEGYPNKRYYGGTKYIDQVELLAIDRLKKIFNVKYANVQPHSGSQANAAALMTVCKPGDTIMGLSLDSGGHLTHGHFLSFSGHFYKPVFYHLNQDGLLDYQEIEQIALREKPKAIICGYSAYSKTIDFKKFREIADKVGAYLIADIAHIAGLIATNNYPTPVGYAHIITSTTHKTLRGPRGGIIMTNDDELAPKIDKAVFPGQQGGPLMHIIAAKAQAFGEVLTDQFKTYCSQIIKNAKA
ncbi:MAG: serine hydroxymethyltransferase, partial [Mycoplasma sp.]|nr:serine hydroxymethyltransferase [Mycoplasma sp.]